MSDTKEMPVTFEEAVDFAYRVNETRPATRERTDDMSKFLQFPKPLPQGGLAYVKAEAITEVFEGQDGNTIIMTGGGWRPVAEPLNAVLAAIQDALEADGTTTIASISAQGEPPGIAPIGSFSWALLRLKKGARVCRRGWNGKGMWLELQTPDANSKMTLPYLYIEYPPGHPAYPIGCRVPWLASQTDLLAVDWEEAKEAANPRRDNPPEPGREWA